jgi:rare lipoprotein A
MTAAHGNLPFGTRVRVTNLENGKSVVVRINDRLGRADRIIDLSRAAGRAIGLSGVGTAKVRLEIVTDTEDRSTREGDERKPGHPR